MVAIIVDHVAIMPGSCRNRCTSVEYALQGLMATGSRRRNIYLSSRRRSGWYATQIRTGAKEEDHEPEAETGQKKARKASQATPTRNPPITIHIIHLVSAIPPPLLLFYSLSQKFFLTKNCCSIITYTEVRDDK